MKTTFLKCFSQVYGLTAVQSIVVNKIYVHILSDVGAAFDIIDHNILIRLENWAMLFQTVLIWFGSHISRTAFFVTPGDHTSGKYDLPFGVAQGSCLGPLPFSLYMLLLGHIIREHKLNFHSYAVDLQLYILLEPDDDNDLCFLSTGMAAVEHWISSKFSLNEHH